MNVSSKQVIVTDGTHSQGGSDTSSTNFYSKGEDGKLFHINLYSARSIFNAGGKTIDSKNKNFCRVSDILKGFKGRSLRFLVS